MSQQYTNLQTDDIDDATGFYRAIFLYIKNYFNIKGRTTRRTFYYTMVWVTAPIIAFMAVGNYGLTYDVEHLVDLSNRVLTIWLITNIIPTLTLLIRRLHDTDRSMIYLLLCFIPFLNVPYFFFFIIMLCEKSKQSKDYGIISKRN